MFCANCFKASAHIPAMVSQMRLLSGQRLWQRTPALCARQAGSWGRRASVWSDSSSSVNVKGARWLWSSATLRRGSEFGKSSEWSHRKALEKTNTSEHKQRPENVSHVQNLDSSPAPKLTTKLREKLQVTRHENIYTIPNLLTASRLVACPFLGYYILQGNWKVATAILAYAGASDLADGFLARRYNMGTVLGSILDPAADKALMTVMVVTLAMKDMLPPLILGRDLALVLMAFYYRYISLPPPKTFARYWNFSIPSAEVHPTQISKYNTFLQLLLVGTTTVSPLVPMDISPVLTGLQYTVAVTTVWSGLSYFISNKSVKILK